MSPRQPEPNAAFRRETVALPHQRCTLQCFNP
jgi:hypothetical protein